MKRKIHVVPHTHWDREWYFTTSRSKVYLMSNLRKIIETLETNDEFSHFMLDAQASLLDDYLKWVPEDEGRIKQLVKSKKLMVGPWYTQSDQMVIGAESIVRNLYYGMKRCNELGGYMNVGYVPDSFGQAGNMPQIFREFNIEDTLFWRGVSNDMVSKTNYNWIGDDGSKVFVTQIPFGYYIGGNIPEGKEESNLFWESECLEKAGKFSATRHIYFPNGFDQAPIRENLPELLKERNKVDKENEYVISSIETYLKDVKSEVPLLEEVHGELLIAKHMRIHKSIFSSRSDLKILNTEIQNYITNILEPLLTLSYQLGNEYPKDALAEIWKLMFENAAHDSIGSCISDTANEDVYMRYKQARDISINLVELHARKIATSIENKENRKMSFTLFNTLPIIRNEVVIADVLLPGEIFSIVDETGESVDYTILNKKDMTRYVLNQTIRLNPSKNIYIPEKVYQAQIAIAAKHLSAFGYNQLYIKLGENSHRELETKDFIENKFYKITCNQNGSLDIYDKLNHINYKEQAVLVENGDDGDSFNYSPPRKDLEVSSKDVDSKHKIEASSIYQKIEMNYTMIVPCDLEERANQKVSVEMPVCMKIELKEDNPVIDFHVVVDNKALSHRVCVLFDAQIATKFNMADQQFGSIQRPNKYHKEMKLYEEGLERTIANEANGVASLIDWEQDVFAWQEPPISIETMQSYVSLHNEEKGIAVLPKGVREYEIIGEHGNMIRLTLFRTYGFMGKENLLYRPGRASGERIIETPDAQLLKKMKFDFGLYIFQSDFNQANVAQVAKEYAAPILCYQYADFLNGRIIFSQMDVDRVRAQSHSLFKTENNLVISATKKCEDMDGYIIRLYNGKYREDVSDVLYFDKDVEEASYMNLKEEKTKSIVVENNKIEIKALSHCKFATVFVKLK